MKSKYSWIQKNPLFTFLYIPFTNKQTKKPMLAKTQRAPFPVLLGRYNQLMRTGEEVTVVVNKSLVNIYFANFKAWLANIFSKWL